MWTLVYGVGVTELMLCTWLWTLVYRVCVTELTLCTWLWTLAYGVCVTELTLCKCTVNIGVWWLCDWINALHMYCEHWCIVSVRLTWRSVYTAWTLVYGVWCLCDWISSLHIQYEHWRVVCLFVVVLHHSNSISVISWRWYYVWDEKEKEKV